MNRLTFVVLATGLTLVGCGKPARSSDPQATTASQLSDETRRCRELGLKAYEDEHCQAAQREQQRRFLGDGGGPPK